MTRLFSLTLTLLFLVYFGTGQLFCLCQADDSCGGLSNILLSTNHAQEASEHAVHHATNFVNSDCCDHCQSGENSISSMNPNSEDSEIVMTVASDSKQKVCLMGAIYQHNLGRAPPCCGLFITDRIFLAKGSLLS